MKPGAYWYIDKNWPSGWELALVEEDEAGNLSVTRMGCEYHERIEDFSYMRLVYIGSPPDVPADIIPYIEL